jgi:hypothetical protein
MLDQKINLATAIADMLSLNKHRDLRNKACFITKELHNKSSINQQNNCASHYASSYHSS